MGSFNKVLLYGNLTADPERIAAKTGRLFTTFSLATNRKWRNKAGEYAAETDFHKIVAFGKLGEIVGTYLKKGSGVLVSGRLSNRSYLNKEGQKRYTTEVVLDDFNFMPRAKKGEQVEQQETLVAA